VDETCIKIGSGRGEGGGREVYSTPQNRKPLACGDGQSPQSWHLASHLALWLQAAAFGGLFLLVGRLTPLLISYVPTDSVPGTGDIN